MTPPPVHLQGPVPVLLVLRALGLGDLLVAVPALRALRRAFPEHRTVLAAPAALEPLVARTGAVDALVPAPGPDRIAWTGPAPDVVVNLHGCGPQSHRALDALEPRRRIGFALPAGDGPAWDGPVWADDAGHERERWCALLTAHDVTADPSDLRLAPPPGAGTGPVVVHPGAAFGSRRWPAERFAAVAAAIAGAGHDVVVTGSADERGLAVAVARAAGLPPDRVLAGRTGVAELVDLVGTARLVVSGDTGVAHLASAFATPSVVLFGPVPPERWGPPPGPHTVLTGPVRAGERFADEPDPALLAVGVDDVLAAAARLLDARGRTEVA